MEWVETTGKSVDDAKDAALDELGIAEDEAEFEIVEEAKQGLFGMLRREARVRARVRPTQPRPKVERRRTKKASGSKGGGSKGSETKSSKPSEKKPAKSAVAAGGASAGKGSGKGSTSKGRSKPAKGADTASANGDEPESTESPTGTDQGASSSPTATDGGGESHSAPGDASDGGDADRGPAGARAVDARRRSGRQRERSRSKASADTTSSSDTTQGATMSESTASLEEQAEITEEFLQGLLDAFGLDGEVSTVSVDDETSEVRIEGDELGLLIGQKGRTLQAVGDLSRTVLQRRLPGRHEGRLRVDVAGYRERRREALQRFAQDVAEQVRSSGTRRVLEPMNPADRKVVHDVLNEVDGVTTTSEGEEPRRRVVVLPDD